MGVSELIAAAAAVQAALDAAEVPNCVIGGLAVARWGEARLTKDVDFAAFSGIGGEPRVIDCVLRVCNGRISDPRTFLYATERSWSSGGGFRWTYRWRRSRSSGA